MVLNKRERYIAIGLIGAVVLLGLDHFVLSPYTARRDRVAADTATAKQKLEDAERLFRKQKQMRRVWAEMNAGGLRYDRDEAESQMLNAVQDWAQESGLQLTSRKPEREVQEGRFVQISFHVTGTGPMSAIAKLLWRVETATLPVRINDMQITPRKEGTDDLQVQLGLSTLCLLPEAEKKDEKQQPRPVASADFKGDRP